MHRALSLLGCCPSDPRFALGLDGRGAICFTAGTPLTWPPAAAPLPAVLQPQHLQLRDAWPLHHGHLHREPPHQLLGSQADHVLVLSQPSLQKLLVTQEEGGLVLAGKHHGSSECLRPLLPGRKRKGSVGSEKARRPQV